MFIKSSLLLFLFCFTLYGVKGENNDQYKGDQLISVDTPTKEVAEKVSSFFKNHVTPVKAEVWSLSSADCQVQLKHTVADAFKEYCKNENITYSVVLDDVQKAIESEHVNNDESNAPSVQYSSTTYQQNIQNNQVVDTSSQQLWRTTAPKFNYMKYNRLKDIQKELFRLSCLYPNKMKTCYVGRSYEKRPLYLVKMTNDMNSLSSHYKPIIWIDGGMHAREWISVASVMYIIKEMLSPENKRKGKIDKLLNENMIYFVPVFNPDGYEYTHTDDRLWRKTRSKTSNPSCRGVDPNRNFDIEWGKGGGSKEPCDNDYEGSRNESEPCVRTFAKIMRTKQTRLKTYWNFHSYSQILFVPNAHKKEFPPDIADLIRVAKKFVDSIKKIENSQYIAFNPPSYSQELFTGTSYDYVHDKLHKTFSFAVELRPATHSTGFLLPKEQIKPTALETLDAILDSTDEIDKILSEREKQKKEKKQMVT